MKVIAIDPGYDRLGIAVMEMYQGKEVVIFSECFETDKNLSILERSKMIGDHFAVLLAEYHPNTLAIETLFFNKNVTTAIGVAQIRGIVTYLAQKNDCTIHEFGPQEIKVAVTGYGKSDKKAVIDMIKKLVPTAPKNALDDEYDAVAVGITCLAHHGRS